MKTFAALAMVGAVVALPSPQGVTSAIAPQETIPAGCSENFAGSFAISVVNVTTTPRRSLQARQDKTLKITLANGVLTDDQGRTGYIAANNQFQFDGPAQTGAIYTAGWSVCANQTLALGNSAIFYQCLSGTFYNLYDESTGEQCSQIYIDVVPDSAAATTRASGSASASASGLASQIGDGQVTASAIASRVTQIPDGQIQATTATPVVTQIPDGQIQATTASRAVSQIPDGQIQAPTRSAAIVSQIHDGQIQAPTSPAVVTPTRPVVSQISDGQIQAPTNGTRTASPSPSVSVFTGSANSVKAGFFGIAGAAVVAAML